MMARIVGIALAALLAGCEPIGQRVIETGADEEVTQLANGALLIRARRQAELQSQTCYVRARFRGVFVPMDCDEARLVNVR
jgi:hypothetical protein